MNDLDEYANNPEPFLATIARLLAHEGDASSVAVLANCKAFIHQTDYDNWDGGSFGYSISLQILSSLYNQIFSQREAIEEKIKDKAKDISRVFEKQYIHNVNISSEIAGDVDWREKANDWIAGKGVTNQGRVRSDNVAPRTCDGLLFRSQPEINLYQAFKKLGVSFAPLPVFIKGGQEYRRIEPDFVVIKNGLMMVVEVDGDTVHRESPAEAHMRTTMLQYEGVHIERLPAKECATMEKADRSAARLIEILLKIKENR